ncbi:hypothetical protein EB151_01220 [archaeon]|jgi:hypothetical protein|nr:hypothetical protein [archaeon]
MKEQILTLRSQGKTYRQIESILKCSRSLISYYINPDGKTKNSNRKNRNRFRLKSEYRKRLGAKCQICGYDKCQNALQFHHIDPSKKKFAISDSLRKTFTQQEIDEEINKCILVCSNCHVEIHSNLIKLDENGASIQT